MTYWAIVSGIEGNLAAYEAVLADIKRQPVEELYILGDVIAAIPESTKVIQRIRSPRANEPVPQVCQGWWEEQLLILHGLGRTEEPTALIERYSMAMVKTLWDAVPREMVEWVRSLDFGFFELDCLLIHGSSVGVDDTLTPDTPVHSLLDRLLRFGANNLFCGRSGLAFQYEIQGGAIATTTQNLDDPPQTETVTITPRQIIGVGNVGRIAGQATYTLYHPGSNQVLFKTVRYGSSKGFQSPRSNLTVRT